jgi:hypothetical protein
MSGVKKHQVSDLEAFDPAQFDVNFSSESDLSMAQSARSRDDKKDDKQMVDQLASIADLMKRIDNQLAQKDKLLRSPVRSVSPA